MKQFFNITIFEKTLLKKIFHPYNPFLYSIKLSGNLLRK